VRAASCATKRQRRTGRIASSDANSFAIDDEEFMIQVLV